MSKEQKEKLRFVVEMFKGRNDLDIFGQTRLTTASELFVQQPHIKEGACFFHPDIKDRAKRLVIYDKSSCCCLSADTRLRKFLVWLINSPFFDTFIILVISLNSL